MQKNTPTSQPKLPALYGEPSLDGASLVVKVVGPIAQRFYGAAISPLPDQEVVEGQFAEALHAEAARVIARNLLCDQISERITDRIEHSCTLVNIAGHALAKNDVAKASRWLLDLRRTTAEIEVLIAKLEALA